MSNDNPEASVSRVNASPLNEMEIGSPEMAEFGGAGGTPFNIDTGEFELEQPDRDYRRYILRHDCVACGPPGEYVARIQLEGWWCVPGNELSDAYLVSLCKEHYQSLAGAPNKNLWWSELGTNPVQEAIWLWECYHAAIFRRSQKMLDSAKENANGAKI
jgi:hypothetical protein